MLSFLGFLAILAPLVIVHEFGHYIFARMFNVRADVFSIGFGPKLWSKQLGETELRVSAIPLGGYVKLFGEEPDLKLSEQEKKRALNYADPWKRFLIFFGGPLFNFLFAIVVFMLILVIGEPQVANVVGRVARGSEADKAGFVSGDRILAIGGKEVTRFNDIYLHLLEHEDKPVPFRIQRDREKRTFDLVVTPSTEDGYTLYGEFKRVGKVDGLLPFPRDLIAGVSDPASAAGQAGIHTGDRIQSIDGRAVTNWESLEEAYASVVRRSTVRLEVVGQDAVPRKIELIKSADAPMSDIWGLHSVELFVEQAVPGDPAEAAGIRKGDRVIAVGAEKVQSFFGLKDAIQRHARLAGDGEGKIKISWERDGKRVSAEIQPKKTTSRDPNLNKVAEYTIGVIPFVSAGEAVMVIDRVLNPFVLAYRGTERMFEFIHRNIVSIGKMLTGEVSVKTLGGPLLIGKLAGDSIEQGLISFLRIMAILSVGLGILNVLPIPVLDGGHLLLLAIESIRRKPLSIRQMEVVQQVGLSIIILLMAIVMRNDITRLLDF